MNDDDPYDLRPIQDPDTGKWDALDARGYGHILNYETRAEAEAWIAGYEVGAMENMENM